jgi:hypothetical protein
MLDQFPTRGPPHFHEQRECRRSEEIGQYIGIFFDLGHERGEAAEHNSFNGLTGSTR